MSHLFAKWLSFEWTHFTVNRYKWRANWATAVTQQYSAGQISGWNIRYQPFVRQKETGVLIEVPPLCQGSVNCNALEAKRKENWHLLVVCMIDGVLC